MMKERPGTGTGAKRFAHPWREGGERGRFMDGLRESVFRSSGKNVSARGKNCHPRDVAVGTDHRRNPVVNFMAPSKDRGHASGAVGALSPPMISLIF